MDNSEQRTTKKSYTKDNISVLDEQTLMRKHPYLYLSSNKVLKYEFLVEEIINNSLDEVLIGECNEIVVVLLMNNGVLVSDNGRGLLVDFDRKINTNVTHTLLTNLYSGCKFNNNSYYFKSGFQGMSLKTVNYFSEYFSIRIYRDGKEYFQEYSKGKALSPLRHEGVTTKQGTTIIFRLDKELFYDYKEFSYDLLKKKLIYSTFLNENLKVTIKDERDANNVREETFQYSDGVFGLVKYLNIDKETIYTPIIYIENNQKEQIEEGDFEIKIKLAFQYIENYEEDRVLVFVNNMLLERENELKLALLIGLCRAFNEYMINYRLFSQLNVENVDVEKGLCCVISSLHTKVKYTSFLKNNICNEEMSSYIVKVVKEGVYNYLVSNKETASELINKIVENYKIRTKVIAAKERIIRKIRREKICQK